MPPAGAAPGSVPTTGGQHMKQPPLAPPASASAAHSMTVKTEPMDVATTSGSNGAPPRPGETANGGTAAQPPLAPRATENSNKTQDGGHGGDTGMKVDEREEDPSFAEKAPLTDNVRVNLFDVRKRLFLQLGPSAVEYWSALKLFVSAKLSKYELDLKLGTMLKGDPMALMLHNQLMTGIMHNAHTATHPPRPSVPFLPGSNRPRGKTSKSESKSRRTQSGLAPLAMRNQGPYKQRPAADVAKANQASTDADRRKQVATPANPALGVPGAHAGPCPRPWRDEYASSTLRGFKRARVIGNRALHGAGAATSAAGTSADGTEPRAAFDVPKQFLLPDFSSLREHMHKIAALKDVKRVNDDTVTLMMYALEVYLKNMIEGCSRLRRPKRSIVVESRTSSGKPRAPRLTMTRHVISALDLDIAMETMPHLLGEGQVYSREKITMIQNTEQQEMTDDM